jgi:hypothetical protein
VVNASIQDPSCPPGDCHVLRVEISSSSKTGVPYPSHRKGRIEDGSGWEEGEQRLIDVEYATAAPSHRQDVQVFHGEPGDHFAQRFWNRCRIQIYTSQGLVLDDVSEKGPTVSPWYVYEYVVAGVRVVQRDADSVYTRVSRRINGRNS